MKKSKKYGPRYDYDPKVDFPKIQEKNRKKLDEIYSNPNWMEDLGRKYYGDNWLATFPDDHYKKTEYKKAVNQGTIRTTMMSDAVEYKYYKRPVIEIFNEEETEYSSIMDWCDKHGKNKPAAYNIIKLIEGRADKDTIYKRTFKWKEE
jgi:hypothetical protein